MKFALAIVVYLLMSLALGWGILQAVHGHLWPLVVTVLAYSAAFAKLGCLPRQSH